MPPPQTPRPARTGSPRRQDTAATLLSPSFSRTAFVPDAASADNNGGHDGAASERPCVSLFEWWLAGVEGDEQKIAVAGTFQRNQDVLEFGPAPVAKRHEPCVLETENGVVVLIYGSLNISRMRGYGYSAKVCEKFLIGFPHWWERCNVRYPKMSSSHSCNSEERSIQFYLEKFQLGERLHSLGSSLISNPLSNDSDAFKKSSYLPNGTPRFEEYTCDRDIPTNQIATALNDDSEGYEAVSNEVDNVEIDLRERGHGEGADDAPPTSQQRTPSTLSKNQDCQNKPQSVLLNEKAVADNMEIVLIAGSTLRESGYDEGADNASPTNACQQRTPVTSLKNQDCRKPQRVALNDKVVADEDMPTSIYSDIPNSCYLSNGTARFDEYTRYGGIPTNEKAVALNGDSERYVAVSKEVENVESGLIVGTVREKGHDDIATNVSLTPTGECSNVVGNEGSENTPLITTYDKRVASFKRSGCPRKTQCVELSEKVVPDQAIPTSVSSDVQFPKKKPLGSPKEQRSACAKLKGAARSPVITTPVPYTHHSHLTRGRANSSSMSTPEALKLRKTSSGRVVVPSLDRGCQRIVYDYDGSISGVVGLDLPAPPKGGR